MSGAFWRTWAMKSNPVMSPRFSRTMSMRGWPVSMVAAANRPSRPVCVSLMRFSSGIGLDGGANGGATLNIVMDEKDINHVSRQGRGGGQRGAARLPGIIRGRRRVVNCRRCGRGRVRGRLKGLHAAGGVGRQRRRIGGRARRSWRPSCPWATRDADRPPGRRSARA